MEMSEKFALLDVLADRYATAPIVNIWSPYQKEVLQRKLWVAALKAQRQLGVRISAKAIRAYEKNINNVNLASIKAREMVTRHNVTASANEFNELAGYDLAHKNFTSRDETDNLEQLQIRDSLLHVRDRSVALLVALGHRGAEFALLNMCGRSHNTPGQAITLGKRFATWAEELIIAFKKLEFIIENYPLRGIKGPMGTQQDIVNLLGSARKAEQFENLIRNYLGFKRVMVSVGQVYPRSLDFEVLSCLVQLSSALGNFATTMRLMAGQDLVIEGFKAGQDGSSLMAHKANSRTCERINGLVNILCGFQDMASRLVGTMWNEGDVSCSVVRRVALSGAFFAFDGICESALTVLGEMEVFPAMVKQELERYLPFLCTSRILTEAMKQGLGRKEAHGIIKEHAIGAIRGMRNGEQNLFIESLGRDSRFPFTSHHIQRLVGCDHGRAPSQIQRVCKTISALSNKYPEAALYKPQPLL